MDWRGKWLDLILDQFVKKGPADGQPIKDISQREKPEFTRTAPVISARLGLLFLRRFQFCGHANESARWKLANFGRFQTMTPVPSLSFSKNAARIGWEKLGSSSLTAR